MSSYVCARVETRIEVHAFGERIAYKRSEATIRTAGVGLPFGVPPVALELLGGLAFLALLAGLARQGALVLVIQRPGYAGVSAVLVLGPVPGARVSRAGGGGGASFYWELADPLGTGMVMLDETGARRVHRTYSPFGVQHASVGPASWLPRHYAGHLEDEESGLVYMQARWMDPQSGTFLSVDPLVGNAFDPQSHNAYSYARNNPASYTDPTGAFGEFTPLIVLDVPAAIFSRLRTIAPYNPAVRSSESYGIQLEVGGMNASQRDSSEPDVTVPPVPPGVSVDENIERIRRLRDLDWESAFDDWFAKVVEGGKWDYKRYEPIGSYEELGNFNYGATGRALGFPREVLLRAAGLVQVLTSWWRGVPHGPGSPFGEAPYGDYPEDPPAIIRGIEYYDRKYGNQ